MQAALITGKELIEFVDFDDPSPEPEQIVVDITYCRYLRNRYSFVPKRWSRMAFDMRP